MVRKEAASVRTSLASVDIRFTTLPTSAPPFGSFDLVSGLPVAIRSKVSDARFSIRPIDAYLTYWSMGRGTFQIGGKCRHRRRVLTSRFLTGCLFLLVYESRTIYPLQRFVKYGSHEFRPNASSCAAGEPQMLQVGLGAEEGSEASQKGVNVRLDISLAGGKIYSI